MPVEVPEDPIASAIQCYSSPRPAKASLGLSKSFQSASRSSREGATASSAAGWAWASV